MSDLTTSPLQGLLSGLMTGHQLAEERYQKQRQQAIDLADQAWRQSQLEMQKNAQKLEADRNKEMADYYAGLLKERQQHNADVADAAKIRDYNGFVTKMLGLGYSLQDSVAAWNASNPQEPHSIEELLQPGPTDPLRGHAMPPQAGTSSSPPPTAPASSPDIRTLFLQGASKMLGLPSSTPAQTPGAAPEKGPPSTPQGGLSPALAQGIASVFSQPAPKVAAGIAHQAAQDTHLANQDRKIPSEIARNLAGAGNLNAQADLRRKQAEFQDALNRATLALKQAEKDNVLSETHRRNALLPLEQQKLTQETALLAGRIQMLGAQVAKENAQTAETWQRVQERKSENQLIRKIGYAAFLQRKGGRRFTDALQRDWSDAGKRLQTASSRYQQASRTLFGAQEQMDAWSAKAQETAPGTKNADPVKHAGALSALDHLKYQLKDLADVVNQARDQWAAAKTEFGNLDAIKRLSSTVTKADGTPDPNATHQMHQQAKKALGGRPLYLPPDGLPGFEMPHAAGHKPTKGSPDDPLGILGHSGKPAGHGALRYDPVTDKFTPIESSPAPRRPKKTGKGKTIKGRTKSGHDYEWHQE